MEKLVHEAPTNDAGIEKSPSGIIGLDQILEGGLPQGRTTLLCGGPGCGKTLLALEFLVRGATEYDEPGVYIAFEETAQELSKNAASLGFNLDELIAQKKIFIDYVYIERSEIEETGEYDLEGLFVRLNDAIQQVGAKRVVLDTLEVLFAGLSSESILRSELRRLFRWLKDKGMTSIVTGERGEGSLTRYGLEEYVSDCVILLENRVVNKISNRILRVVKFRGSSHGGDEYPFMISDRGVWVLPITSSGLTYQVSKDRFQSGIPRLDAMLGGEGFYRGSTVLISGTAGTGKTSLVSSIVNAACLRAERVLYFAFEESPHQIIRNMYSIGLDLQSYADQDYLRFVARRPSMYGLETHLLTIEYAVENYQPSVVVIDPITNLTSIGSSSEVKSILVRIVDSLKMKGITTFFTSLTNGDAHEVSTEVGISSLMDTWLLVRNLETNGEHNRALYILKSRGMLHSNQIREFLITDQGIKLVEVRSGAQGILTGSARMAQQAQESADVLLRQQQIDRKKREITRRRQVVMDQINALQAQLEDEESELKYVLQEEEQRLNTARQKDEQMDRSRNDDQG